VFAIRPGHSVSLDEFLVAHEDNKISDGVIDILCTVVNKMG